MLKTRIANTSLPFAEKRSCKGYFWQWRCDDERLIVALQQHFQLAEIMGRVLAGRGATLETVEDMLYPTLRRLMPDPSNIRDMDKAASRLADAIMSEEKIAVFGDYDVDGATSSALLSRFLHALGQEPVIYIPDRMREGYGPNVAAMESLARDGATLIITVDCGTVAFEPVAAAKAEGAEVIVVDHHQGELHLPEAVAVVNPNRVDETGEYGYLAAVGVTFLLLVATTRELRQRNLVSDAMPDLRQWLDIVALGTVCDVVPFKGVNRAFVAQGLKVMAGRQNTGIDALLQVARVEELPGVYHAGYVLGPRINAGGRVGNQDYGSRLLATESAEEARELALKLDQYNAERQAIEVLVLEQALEMAGRQENMPVICLAGRGWHPGVIGIVAGRVKETCDRPVAIISLQDGLGKASARSVPGVDIGAAVISARQEGLLLAGGGHAMAAGFTVEEGNIAELHRFFCERMGAGVAEYSETKILKLDGVVSPGGITHELSMQLEAAGPYGMGYPQPVFAVTNCRVVKADIVGRGHVRAILADPNGKGRCKAVAFRAAEHKVGQALLNHGGNIVHVAGTVRSNHWNGRITAELHIIDVMDKG